MAARKVETSKRRNVETKATVPARRTTKRVPEGVPPVGRQRAPAVARRIPKSGRKSSAGERIGDPGVAEETPKSLRKQAEQLSHETIPQRKRRAVKIVAALKAEYPEATCALHHHNPFQLLIATILSAQSTDETVNRVTPTLFGRYTDAPALGAAAAGEVEKLIYPTGFFRQKTKSIQGASRAIVERYAGRVPETMDDLLTLPGVARKTANVVLGTAFGKNEGCVVDTHVGRLATRLALTWSSKGPKDAVKIERDLMQVIPQADWTFTGHALIWHGRRVCTAKKPKCDKCAIARLCPSAFTFE